MFRFDKFVYRTVFQHLETEVPTLLARLQELKECHQEKDAEERFKQFVDINEESSER